MNDGTQSKVIYTVAVLVLLIPIGIVVFLWWPTVYWYEIEYPESILFNELVRPSIGKPAFDGVLVGNTEKDGLVESVALPDALWAIGGETHRLADVTTELLQRYGAVREVPWYEDPEGAERLEVEDGSSFCFLSGRLIAAALKGSVTFKGKKLLTFPATWDEVIERMGEPIRSVRQVYLRRKDELFHIDI